MCTNQIMITYLIRRNQNSYMIRVRLPLAAHFDVSVFCLTEDLEKRPKLKLQPRTVKVEVNDLADSSGRTGIFGSGRPRDEKQYEDRPKQRSRNESQSSDDRVPSPQT